MRAFVALEPGAEIAEWMELVTAELRTRIDRQGVRFVPSDRRHLVLASGELINSTFLPGIDVGPVQLGASVLGALPNPVRPASIGMNIDPEALAATRAVLMPFFAEGIRTDQEPPPHVSLARISPASQKVGAAVRDLIAKYAELPPHTWTSHTISVCSMEPSGLVTKVAEIALAG